MTGSDPHSFIGVYALDALDSAEKALFEEHLRECPTCRAEVTELTRTASRLAGAAAAPAPAELRTRVLAAAAGIRQQSPLPAVSDISERTRRRNPRWYAQPVAAAAALLLVVSGGLGVLALDEHQRAEDAEQMATRVAAIATHPDRVQLDVPVSSGGHGIVVAADGSALFRTSDIERLPADRAYQLWILRGDTPESVGVLGRGGQLEAFVDGVRPTDALGLTVEPADGSDRPTGNMVLRVEIT